MIRYVKALHTVPPAVPESRCHQLSSARRFDTADLGRSETLEITGNPNAAAVKSRVRDLEHGPGPIRQPYPGWTFFTIGRAGVLLATGPSASDQYSRQGVP